jgi:hypothetical protein
MEADVGTSVDFVIPHIPLTPRSHARSLTVLEEKHSPTTHHPPGDILSV